MVLSDDSDIELHKGDLLQKYGIINADGSLGEVTGKIHNAILLETFMKIKKIRAGLADNIVKSRTPSI